MPDALAATLLSYKTVPTRKVFQMTLELPIEQASAAIALFGKADPDGATWLAVARLTAPVPAKPEPVAEPERAKTFRSNKAAVMVKENQDFKNWLVDTYWTGKEKIGDYDGLLKRALGIQSKKELDVDGPAADRWEQMLTSFTYRAQVRA